MQYNTNFHNYFSRKKNIFVFLLWYIYKYNFSISQSMRAKICMANLNFLTQQPSTIISINAYNLKKK